MMTKVGLFEEGGGPTGVTGDNSSDHKKSLGQQAAAESRHGVNNLSFPHANFG